ncbi:MAG TPA: hypothetical protein VMF52_07630, partial [Steroidobacteraceae bacterium]|nr:hypothetical protein [Steroidobacteraceae bacterium]
MRLAPWLLALAVLFSLWKLYDGRDIHRAPGILAAAEPLQREIDGAALLDRGEFKLRPRAEFRATVRVLRREDYSFGELAKLVPTDFAVGWGPLSDSKVLEDVAITQSNRFYFWRTEHWPVDRATIESHSANWHVIPDNDGVRAQLKKLRSGSVVELAGELVDVEGPEGTLRTSLVRTDTGAGACEVLLAKSVRVVEV